ALPRPTDRRTPPSLSPPSRPERGHSPRAVGSARALPARTIVIRSSLTTCELPAGLRPAICDLPACDLRPATCDLSDLPPPSRPATCHLPPATSDARDRR